MHARQAEQRRLQHLLTDKYGSDPMVDGHHRDALQSEVAVLCTLAKLDSAAFSVADSAPVSSGEGQRISLVVAEGAEVVLPLAGDESHHFLCFAQAKKEMWQMCGRRATCSIFEHFEQDLVFRACCRCASTTEGNGPAQRKQQMEQVGGQAVSWTA